jgi:hypothetical protein
MEMYRRGLATFERLHDAQGVTGAWTNIGELYLRTDRAEEAKPLLRQAYLVLSHLGSSHADIAAQRLAEACGSADAASAYVAELIAQPVD